MKYLVPILFSCFLSFSQTNDSIYNKAKNNYAFTIKLDSIINPKPSFNYKFKPNDIASLSVYNRNTKLNDVYHLSTDSIYFVKTVNFNSNQFAQEDSFNPNGVSDLGAGLIIGSINTVFNIIFKN